jgi:hypothetical protein
MTTKAYQKIKKEIKQELLDEFVLPILKTVKDPEGEYNPKFVKEVLKATKEKPLYTYNSKTFLKQINS